MLYFILHSVFDWMLQNLPYISALPLEGLALVEGVSGAAGGVDARGEAGVAASHVGVVRGRVVAERVRGAAAGRDVGRGLQMIHGFG